MGYVYHRFILDAITKYALPVLAAHDKAKVEVTCYSDAGLASRDDVTAALKGCADRWRDTGPLADFQLARAVRADGIDVLVDLTGHRGDHRLLAFARRPAPVQMTCLYPFTTGLTAIDYRVTDAICDPPGDSRRLGVEKLIRLERRHLAYRPSCSPAIGPPPSQAPSGHITFGSVNRAAKLNPRVARTWGRVLHSVPGSRLLVLAVGGEKNLAVRRLLEAGGVPGDRLELVPQLAEPDYMALHNRIDVALDPFPTTGPRRPATRSGWACRWSPWRGRSTRGGWRPACWRRSGWRTWWRRRRSSTSPWPRPSPATRSACAACGAACRTG